MTCDGKKFQRVSKGNHFQRVPFGGSCPKNGVVEPNMNEIREYYIYCSDKDKYKYLKDKYSKLKGIYNKFSYLIKKLKNIKEIKIDNISSSNLIYF